MFTGILPALVTPLNEDHTVNERVVRELLEYELTQGADGFYITGATGEGFVMRPEARMDMAEIAVNQLAGRKPCIAHVAAVDLEPTLRLARHAERAGCDCVAAIPPIYFPYGQDEIYRYYHAISEAVHIPVMIYHHPAAGVELPADFIKRLFEIDNIRAVKWSYPNYFEMLRLKDITHGEMNILNGPDETLLCGLAVGADAGIGTTYNFLLPEFKALYAAFRAGEMRQALVEQQKIDRIIHVLFSYPLIPATKAVMRCKGFDVGHATDPMKRLTAEEAETLILSLTQAGLEL